MQHYTMNPHHSVKLLIKGVDMRSNNLKRHQTVPKQIAAIACRGAKISHHSKNEEANIETCEYGDWHRE